MRYMVIRQACLMEDEGQDHFIGSYMFLHQAMNKVDEWTDNGTGYFTYSDMKVIDTLTGKVVPIDKG